MNTFFAERFPQATSRLLFVVMKTSMWLLDLALDGYCSIFVPDTFTIYNLTHIQHFNKATNIYYEYQSLSFDSENPLNSEIVYEKLKAESYFKVF